MIFSALVFSQAFNPAQAQTQPIPEVEVTKTFILDYEFDWGRDGSYCPTCNFGAGNARFAFTDALGNLWVGQVDPNTGAFSPTNGKGVLVDTSAAYAGVFGNGPEWMTTSTGSELVYTKYVVGSAKTAADVSLGIAGMTNGAWAGGYLSGGAAGYVPFGSLDANDPQPRVVYQNKSDAKVYTRYVSNPASAAPLINKGTCSRRWVNGQHALIYTAPCLGRPNQITQAYVYNIDTLVETQLTFDPTPKEFGFMWQAPEYNNDYVFFTVSNLVTLQIYHMVTNADGSVTPTLVDSITPGGTLPYIQSPEPFVFNGKSYVFMQLSQFSDANNLTAPTQLALTGIDPTTPSFRMLTNDTSVQRLRLDPEYFITSQGPYIYYNRYYPQVGTTTIQPDGVWRVDTYLGPPVPPAAPSIQKPE